MKVLYVVKAESGKYASFKAVQVWEEREEDFEIVDKIEIEDYIHEFPKNKLNTEFEFGYVTDKLDKRMLKTQLNRVYCKLCEIHRKNNDMDSLDGNTRYYEGSLEDLEGCITPEELQKEKNTINPDEANKVIENLVTQVDSKELGIFISLLSHRYMQETGITKEQFMTSLSNSIDKLE